MKGKFVISLDFEIHWGVFDALSLDTYKENLTNVPKVVDQLIALSDQYDVKLTFSTVGLLFATDKNDIEKYMPSSLPKYEDSQLDPFRLINTVGNDENTDPLHYANSIIRKIKKASVHEIGTHTFAHYNCLASGQEKEAFEADLTAAKKIANDQNINIQSIVFPKNQVNKEYLKICTKHGILSYRGCEAHGIYNPNVGSVLKKFPPLVRLSRLLDSYINLTGSNTYDIEEIALQNSKLINLPSSRFLRPYVPKLFFLEGLKIRRIKKAMQHAAKNGELFHLWWHPHNFGANLDENFKNLESIFKEFSKLRERFDFESETMTSLSEQLVGHKFANQ
ncbi:polysaccharide deacetylase family protein [Aquimarina sp. U1-2]|uniref:polysaccharide deacetylase family protein n=1 Tax=Aquimarina sp. U1-2 TaxID=2823141 RepID=UPI001AECF580|nr:polysaccharide deacetylase family protein [Aquimarina sp. U1-2]MBP2832014.1 polysaccharide deacetylase family protein [Aquimarina sp. U1-2]